MKLTKAQQKILEKARTIPVVETLESDGKKTYRFIDGRNVRADVFSRLLEGGMLTPQGDGLFAGFSQTYIALSQ